MAEDGSDGAKGRPRRGDRERIRGGEKRKFNYLPLLWFYPF